MNEYETCFLCRKNTYSDPLETHEIFFGNPNRKLSIQYGLQVRLCGAECHRLGKNSVHMNKEVDQKLKEYGQNKFMQEQNATIEDFIKIFGRNYI